MATLLSVNVGLPADVAWQGRTVHTGIWKRSVAGPRVVGRLNVDGDGQGDLRGHGGPHRAVLVYQLDSYRYWSSYFGRDDFEFGQFGENFTVDGLADEEVCIGDRYRIGAAEFEVSQPRVTCYRVGMRLSEPGLAALLVAHHRPGFYLRVITQGTVQAGDDVVRTRVGPHRLSVAEVDGLLYLPGRDRRRLQHAVGVPALSPGWVRSFHEMLDATGADDVPAGSTTRTQPGWSGFRRLKVERLVVETAAITSVHLAAADGGPLPPPRPGQYLSLRVPGPDGRPAVRNYSLSSAPGAATYRISVKREDHGAVSRFVHLQLRPGDLVDAAAPRGQFVLADEPTPVLLLSAGIGATPVLAMLQQLAASGSPREVWWIHVARNPGEHAFAAEAHRLLRTLSHAHENVFYSDPALDPSPAPRATRGRPTLAALAVLGVPAGATAYLCGPAGFMTDMSAALAALGIRADRIHTELFTALPQSRPGVVCEELVPPHLPAGQGGTGPDVTFVRSGLTVPWNGQRHSLLELAESSDVPARFSCRTGVCHTCSTPLVSGNVTYDPAPLEAPAESSVLLCCARPAGPIVLDL